MSRKNSNNSVSGGSGIKIGRKLPGFSIPSSSSSSTREEKPILSPSERLMEEGFYDDIFGCSNRRTSRSTTKSSSSSKSNNSRSKSKAAHSGSSTTSVPSSEDTIMIPSNIDMISVMPPPPPTTTTSAHHRLHHQHKKAEDDHEDAILSFFTSKLRPITIPIRRSRGYKYDFSPPSTVSSGTEAEVQESSSQRSLITINPLSTTFMDLSSSSSAPLPTPSPDVKRIFSFDASSIRPLFTDKKQVVVQVQEDEGGVNSEDDDQNENDSDIESERSSVVKDIDYGSRGETEGAAAVDEAIAWAKDKFWNGRPPTDTSDT